MSLVDFLTPAKIALAEKIAERLPETEVGKQIIAEDLAAIQEKRRAAGEALKQIEAEAGKTLPTLKTATAKARAEFVKLSQAAREAEKRLNQSAAAELAAQAKYHRDRDTHRATLEQTADPTIAEFLGALNKHWEDNRFSIVHYHEQRTYKFWEARKRTQITTNGQFVRLWSEAIDEARTAALALRYEVGEVDIPKRLAEIRAEVPIFNGEHINPMFESTSTLMPLPPAEYRDKGKMSQVF